MDNHIVGRRAQDVQAGLRDVVDPIVQSVIPVTRQIGMAALLAVHIRGLERITNIPGLTAVASNLGIRGSELNLVLHILEEAGWLRVSPNVYNPTWIDETIPQFQQLYTTLGEQWSDRQPGELESATIQLIETLATVPQPVGNVVGSTGLETATLDTVVELGELGGYIRRYRSPRDNHEIIYSPLFIDEHPESLLNCIAKHQDQYGELQKILSAVRGHPGIPVKSLATSHPLVAELLNSNVLCAPAVDSSSGRQHFLFPHIRTVHNKAVIGKARVLVACVRYGQSFSTITKVANPVDLLRNLRRYKRIGRVPHSNIRTQYAPASDAGLGFFEDHGGRFSFHLYDIPENIEAIDLAIEMCEGQTESEAHLILDTSELRNSLSTEAPSGIILPPSNRGYARDIVRSRKLDPHTKTYQRLNSALFDDLRGVHRVIR